MLITGNTIYTRYEVFLEYLHSGLNNIPCRTTIPAAHRLTYYKIKSIYYRLPERKKYHDAIVATMRHRMQPYTFHALALSNLLYCGGVKEFIVNYLVREKREEREGRKALHYI